MKRFVLLLALSVLVCAIVGLASFAADAAPPPPSAGDPTTAAEKQKVVTAAAAAAATAASREVHAPDFLEQLVDVILGLFDIRSSGNTATHYIISISLLVAGLILRRIVTSLVFGVFRRMAKRTETTLDDKLFIALEGPVGALVMLVAIFSALKVLKLSPNADAMIAYSSTVAFSIAIFWLLLRGFSTALDHAHTLALAKHKGIAAFMPWIKKTLIAIFVVVGMLMVIQSLGYNVRAILAGLG